MNDTENQIVIHADPDRVFALAAAVERWPEFLPHYRWVRVLNEDAGCRTVEMAARRSWLPLRWVSRQWRDPEARRIRFRHIGGLSRGMTVEWRIDPVPEGTRVVIWHGLELEVPLVGTALGRRIVGEGFVRPIAGRTLACIKARVESEGANSAPEESCSDG
jgi:ribosome-associated toxin RatA of RatAB toxin-antitoxin module